MSQKLRKVHYGLASSRTSVCGLSHHQISREGDIIRGTGFSSHFHFRSDRGEYPCKLCVKRFGKQIQLEFDFNV